MNGCHIGKTALLRGSTIWERFIILMHNKQQADFLLFPLHKRYTILMVRQRTNQPVLPDLTKSNQLGTTLKHFGHFVKCSFSICPILVNLLCYWENFHWCIWPNNFFKNESSGHTGTSLPSSTGAKKIFARQKKDKFRGLQFSRGPTLRGDSIEPSVVVVVVVGSSSERGRDAKMFENISAGFLPPFKPIFGLILGLSETNELGNQCL